MQQTPPPDWQALSALYDEAEALAPAEREAWLARLQAQAHPMAPRLRKMLAAPTAFLHALPQWHEEPAGEAEGLHGQAGQLVGGYRLLQPLGAGGMAEVWLAERADGSFERQVALKLLAVQPGAVRAQTFRRRFEREHRILATLRHEHIAALFDAGITPEGQHWLALEFVRGQAIDAWCDAARIGLRARVLLFRQVLQAVAHAHARLVIHRDLKPANVMVTEAGQVRLLDFGIATLLEDDAEHDMTELTRAGGRPMTLRYASPEQLQGLPLNATSDVYTLGVMLYELLCGQPPHAPPTRGAGAMSLAILAGEPLPPSRKTPTPDALAARGLHATALQRQLSGELDAIVLRAMALDSGARYGSADAFDADLARWLADEPVQARLPGPVERLWKFARRQPVGTGLGVSALLALSALAAVAFNQASQARAEAARAQQASGFMLRLFEDADPDRHGGKSPTPAELLVLGRQRIASDSDTSLALKTELLEGIGRAQNDMAEYDAAEATYAQWLALCEQGCEPSRLAWALTWRAENELRRFDLAQATRWLDQADRVQPLAQAAPALQAKRHEVRAWVAQYQGRLDDAEQNFEQGLKAQSASPAPAHRQMFDLWLGSARNDARRGQGQRAVDSLAAAQTHLGPIVRQRPSALHELAQIRSEILVDLGRYGELQTSLNKDLQDCQTARQELSMACRILRINAALAWLRLGYRSRVVPSDLVRVADAASTEPQRMNALQWAHRAAWQGSDAGSLADTTQRLRALEVEAKSTRTRLRAMLALAESSLGESHTRAAIDRLDEAWNLALQNKLAEGYLGAQIQLTSGLAWLQAGQPAKGLVLLEAAQRVFDEELGVARPLAQWMGLNRAVALCAMGESARALALVDAALPVLESSWGKSTPSVERVHALRRSVAGAGVGEPGARGCGPKGFQPFH